MIFLMVFDDNLKGHSKNMRFINIADKLVDKLKMTNTKAITGKNFLLKEIVFLNYKAILLLMNRKLICT